MPPQSAKHERCGVFSVRRKNHSPCPHRRHAAEHLEKERRQRQLPAFVSLASLALDDWRGTALTVMWMIGGWPRTVRFIQGQPGTSSRDLGPSQPGTDPALAFRSKLGPPLQRSEDLVPLLASTMPTEGAPAPDPRLPPSLPSVSCGFPTLDSAAKRARDVRDCRLTFPRFEALGFPASTNLFSFSAVHPQSANHGASVPASKENGGELE